MADAALRQLIVLMNIPREPDSVTSSRLVKILQDANHDAKLRTIQRDLVHLSTQFPIVQTQPTGPGRTGMGWSFNRKEKSITFPIMGSSAALSLSMAFQYLHQIIPTQALENLEPLKKEAETLLAKQNSGIYKKWTEKVRAISQHFLMPPTYQSDVIDKIYHALLNEKKFKATYKGKERIINPYGLIQQGHTLYLICCYEGYDKELRTAVHRFKQVEVLNEVINPNPNFNIDHYVRQGHMKWLVNDGEVIQVKLRVYGDLINILQETPISEDQKTESIPECDGSNLVTATLPNTVELRRWILSQGDELEVLEPLALREWVAENILNMAKRYQ